MILIFFVRFAFTYLFITSISCNYFSSDLSNVKPADTVTVLTPEEVTDEPQTAAVDSFSISNVVNNDRDIEGEVSPEQLVAYAKTLIGTPYKYASIDPAEGLDCSGFITHVFNHFSIKVPRSSVDFTNYGITVDPADAETGNLILFTGTDTLSEVVGHMGIVTEVAGGELEFIHSTSGKAYAVTISKLNAHYRKRFVKVIRISYSAIAKF